MATMTLVEAVRTGLRAGGRRSRSGLRVGSGTEAGFFGSDLRGCCSSGRVQARGAVPAEDALVQAHELGRGLQPCTDSN
jgi:hypothetical protein